MAIVSWNVRGLNGEEAMRQVKLLVKYHKLDLLFLMETKLTEGKVNTIGNRLGFEHGFEVPRVGLGGGLMILWKDKLECSISLAAWNQSKFGSLAREIKETHQQVIFLHNIQDQIDTNSELKVKEHKLNELLYKEEVFWKQRSRILWLEAGDRNTKFFHQRAKKRNKINAIKGLLNEENEWCPNETKCSEIVQRFYQKLFTSNFPTVEKIEECLIAVQPTRVFPP
ncbi:hypothetical protein POM88_007739 [Heracleum sosnowskyi]|uniref:Endonuclease/exonuclease/phosphatase domain-containing protein n=1 Tax=Heracleum sosnowskyi TaxID=360622 RepID=A0AAD8N6R3_9APIA|nr:hypothetical protein POM88_007739 [Heracleum sosnowskyi]